MIFSFFLILYYQNPIPGHEEDDSFTTQQLFSFAWQIARGMVTLNQAVIYIYLSEDLSLLSHIHREKPLSF